MRIGTESNFYITYIAIFGPENRNIAPKEACFFKFFYFISSGWSGLTHTLMGVPHPVPMCGGIPDHWEACPVCDTCGLFFRPFPP
jgi:hypothetical protein